MFLLILLMALCAGGYYLYITYGVMSEQAESDLPAKQLSIQKKDWKKIIFDDPTFQILKSPLSEPLSTGEKGNDAPFLE